MREKLEHQLGGQILEPERRDGPVSDIPGKPEQQLEGVAIGRGDVIDARFVR